MVNRFRAWRQLHCGRHPLHGTVHSVFSAQPPRYTVERDRLSRIHNATLRSLLMCGKGGMGGVRMLLKTDIVHGRRIEHRYPV
jgi:hypothetical protein